MRNNLNKADKKEIPLVSVIIPVYNAEDYIDDCIYRIMHQTYKNIEIVICDDASSDNSYEIICKYKDFDNVKVLRNDHNRRQAFTRNRCIKACDGQYIMLQDADDVAEPNRVEKLLNSLFSEKKDISFVGSYCYIFDEQGTYDKIGVKQEYPEKKDLLWGIPFVHATIMFDKKCLMEVDGYRVSKVTERGEDYDLIMRLYAKGFRGKNIPDELYGYRVDKNAYDRRTFKARLDESVIRFQGFKNNKNLFPTGIFYVFKPIVAHFYQIIKIRKMQIMRKTK